MLDFVDSEAYYFCYGVSHSLTFTITFAFFSFAVSFLPFDLFFIPLLTFYGTMEQTMTMHSFYARAYVLDARIIFLCV